MSDNENNYQVDPSWTSFDEMKKYAKDTAGNAVQLELNQDEIFNEYFATFKPSEYVVACLNLTNAFINYTHDNSLLEDTKKFTEDLRVKWENGFPSNDSKVDDSREGSSGEVVANSKDSSDIEVTEQDGQLGLFGEVVDDEEQKKITDLKKKMKSVKVEYDLNLSLAENQKVYDTAKKANDEEKKKGKQIDDLKAKMDELYFEYDETISYTENKAIYNKAVDKSANPSYTFPFKIYFKGCDVRELDYIFDENHQYTVKEICELMFKHGFKEYAGEVKLVYEKEENMFVPDFSSQRHG